MFKNIVRFPHYDVVTETPDGDYFLVPMADISRLSVLPENENRNGLRIRAYTRNDPDYGFVIEGAEAAQLERDFYAYHEGQPAPQPSGPGPEERLKIVKGLNEALGVNPAPLPPARSVLAQRADLVVAVRNMFSNRAGIIDQNRLKEFLLDILGDQKPAGNPDPALLIQALRLIERNSPADDGLPSDLATEALRGYFG